MQWEQVDKIGVRSQHLWNVVNIQQTVHSLINLRLIMLIQTDKFLVNIKEKWTMG